MSLCASACTGSHHKSQSPSSIQLQKLEISIYNYWANPTRANNAVPSSGTRFSRAILSYARMDEDQVAQRVLGSRMFSQWFHTHCVSRSPLCSLSGTSSRTGKGGITTPLSRKATAERRKKTGSKRCQNKVGHLDQPKAAFSICLFLVCHFTRIWESTKVYTQQSICRMASVHLKSCLRLFTDENMA